MILDKLANVWIVTGNMFSSKRLISFVFKTRLFQTIFKRDLERFRDEGVKFFVGMVNSDIEKRRQARAVINRCLEPTLHEGNNKRFSKNYQSKDK